MPKIALSVGHGAKIRGAAGPSPWGLDEVDEAYRVVGEVANKLKNANVEVETYFDTISTSQSENLNRITNWHNNSAFGGSSHDLDVSCHFNAYDVTSKPMGCEVWYYSKATLAAEVSAAMANALDLPDRGGKYTDDLYVISNTTAPCVLLECCFVDSSTDAEHYRERFDDLCRALAESLGGVSIDEQPEPPEEVETPPPEQVTGNNRVLITSKVVGDVSIYINNTLIRGHEDCEHTLDLKAELVGDVVVVVNGEAFHNKPPVEAPGIPANHKNIEATVFGGEADNEYSAYPPYDSSGRGPYMDDESLYVALPYSFPLDRWPDNIPKVRVFCGELSAVGVVADKGPWTTDDDAYVNGAARPIAETCHDEDAPLPSGPNKGQVPSNRAGIDLSPALAERLGIDGKGHVDWQLEEE
jgi:N-acetylmuramoyl-L-alanine amidase